MFVKRILQAATLAAALVAAPAQAAIVELTFRDQPGAGGATSIFGPNIYLDWQNSFHTGALGGDYAFKFTYDTALAGPNYGLTLVSGRVGGFTDFAGWNASLIFNPNSSLFIQLVRTVSLTASIHYTGGAYFILRDDDGDLGPTLPEALNVANLDLATTSLEIRSTGGAGGQRYRNVGFARFDGAVEVPRGDGDLPVGGVPEPGTWALMILGFGGAGAMLRSRRRTAMA